MRRLNQRFNPNDLVSISQPKKSDVRAPPIPEVPDSLVGRNMQLTSVIEEWQNTAVVAVLVTEEWENNVPPDLVVITTEEWFNTSLPSGLVVEEWVNNPPTLTVITTDEWQNEPPTLQLKTTETMTGNYFNAPFYNGTVANAVQNLKGAGGTTLDAVGEVLKAGALDTKVELFSAIFKLKKVGSPTGNAFLRLRNASQVTLKTGTGIDVSTISTTATDYTFFVDGTAWLLQTGYSITIEYTGGTSTDYIEVSTQDPITAGQYNMLTHSPTNGWLETTTIGVYGNWD